MLHLTRPEALPLMFTVFNRFMMISKSSRSVVCCDTDVLFSGFWSGWCVEQSPKLLCPGALASTECLHVFCEWMIVYCELKCVWDQCNPACFQCMAGHTVHAHQRWSPCYMINLCHLQQIPEQLVSQNMLFLLCERFIRSTCTSAVYLEALLCCCLCSGVVFPIRPERGVLEPCSPCWGVMSGVTAVLCVWETTGAQEVKELGEKETREKLLRWILSLPSPCHEPLA